MGAFLLWTITFALADEGNQTKKAEVLTGSVAQMPNTPSITAASETTAEVPEVAETTTWDTAEAPEAAETTTWYTAEAPEAAETTTWDTAEAPEVAEATTWDTAEAPEVAEATTWDTAEAPEAAEATTWDTAEAPEAAEATTWAVADDSETVTTTETADVATPTISDSAKKQYDEEQIAAYEWAFNNGITTINDIDKARLPDWLTRAELAKMMSQYMTKVLWKTPAETEKVAYADVDESLGDLADFIQVAYAYKIMWIDGNGNALENFNPGGLVTRAEYATVFSRVLYGDKYNKSEWNYYEDHLAALKEAGILTNTTPTIQEVRGWVMLMMYRSVNAKAETPAEETAEPVVGIANPASEYCVAQGGTVNIVKDEEGNESGMCKLADGTEVDEWEYYRENNKEEAAPAEEATPAEATTWDTAEAPEATTTESN